jgi:hypothetical protein
LQFGDGDLLVYSALHSGLTDAEMQQVDAFVKKNMSAFGPGGP